jgi:hypothetical protein
VNCFVIAGLANTRLANQMSIAIILLARDSSTKGEKPHKQQDPTGADGSLPGLVYSDAKS